MTNAQDAISRAADFLECRMPCWPNFPQLAPLSMLIPATIA
jgi:hypothetical protein